MSHHRMFSRFSAVLGSGRSAHRATPPGCTHAVARTAGAWRCGDPRLSRGAARSLPPPLPRASRVGPSRPTARRVRRALARCCGRSAGSQVPAAGPRLHRAHRALFLCPDRKAKTIGAAQAREGNGKQEGRRRREVTLASVPGLARARARSRVAGATQLLGLRRGLAESGSERKLCAAALGILCCCTCFSLRRLPGTHVCRLAQE